MSPLAATYLILFLSVILEVIGTSLLAVSNQFTRLWPTIGTAICYASAFYLLSHAVKVIPVGIVYALWSGAGVVLISLVGVIWLRQSLDFAAILGMSLIVAGVAVVNLFSKSVTH